MQTTAPAPPARNSEWLLRESPRSVRRLIVSDIDARGVIYFLNDTHRGSATSDYYDRRDPAEWRQLLADGRLTAYVPAPPGPGERRCPACRGSFFLTEHDLTLTPCPCGTGVVPAKAMEATSHG